MANIVITINTQNVTVTDEQFMQLKKDLRISSNFDDEITQGIGTALSEMSRAGVTALDMAEPLVFKCVELYLKFAFNFQADGENYYNHFQRLCDKLALTASYVG